MMNKPQTPELKKAVQVPPAAHAKVGSGSVTPAPKLPPKSPNSNSTADEVALVEAGEKVSILKPGLLLRAAILAFINLIAVSGIIILNGRLYSKAQEVKRLRSLQLTASKGGDAFSSLKSEVEGEEKKFQDILKYFPDSEGLVSFVEEIDTIKAEGVVTGFSFASEAPVKDKTGGTGLPVVFEMRGDWGQIGGTLQKILTLPYAIRSVLFEAIPSPEDTNILQVKFGGILYVDKTFSKN